MAPQLKIPVSGDLTKLKEAMKETSSLASTASRAVLKQFTDMANELSGPVAAKLALGFTKSALGISAKLALVIGTVKLMGDAVDAVRGQLQRMIEVAEKATNLNVSPEFFQSFMQGAKDATDKVELFESALSNAFQALKPVLNPEWSAWDAGLQKVTAVEQSMREMRELFTTSQDSSGLTMFRNASSQDERIAAVLTFMRQLQTIGQEAAALDLGDKLFGARFTDKIRTGQESIDGLLDNLKTKSETAFSNKAVERAKELDDQLKAAWATVDQNLHPSLEALDLVALKIKSVWVDIVKLMGAAAALLPGITIGTANQEIIQNRAQETRLQGRLRDTGLTSQQRSGLEDQLRAVQSKLAQLEASAVPQAPAELGGGDGGNVIPLPRRRPQDAPAPPKATGSSAPSRFDTAADAVEKRAAAIKAETDNIDQNTAARERARMVAQLEVVAKQANAAAGRGENLVTEEQKRRIEEVAQAYENVVAAAEKAKVASDIKFGSGTAFLSQEDVSIAQTLKGIYGSDIPAALNSTEAATMRLNNATRDVANTISGNLTSGIADVIDGTKTAGQAFSDFGRVVIRALEEAIIKIAIVGPMMRALQGGMGFLGFAGGGMVPSAGSAGLSLTGTGGLYADGGVIRGPGTGRSDSILARVSNGEFVVNAAATSRHRQLLEAVNDNRLPRFADGGLIGSSPAAGAPMMQGGPIIAPSIAVTVQGSAGQSTKDHAAMGEAIAKAADQHIRKTIAAELRTQMRPGGIMKR